MPSTDKAVVESNKFQLNVITPISLPKPMSDLQAMINKEVAIAFFIGSLPKNTNEGMIKNPPPAPTKPVSIPTEKPASITNGIFSLIWLSSSSLVHFSHLLIIEYEAPIIIIEKSKSMDKSLLISMPPKLNFSGIQGMRITLEKYTDKTEGIPKYSTDGKCIFLLLK